MDPERLSTALCLVVLVLALRLVYVAIRAALA